MIFGHLESLYPIAVGWAVDTASKNGCIIDIFIDHMLHSSFIVGSDQRKDVQDALKDTIEIDDLQCGFRIDLTGAVSEAGSHVELRYNKTGETMNGNNKIFLSRSVQPSRVFEGVNGYKFFCGDRLELIERFSGNCEASKKDIETWCYRYCLTGAAVKNAGGVFIPVVVPEKISAAPHLVSEDFKISNTRLIEKLSMRAKNAFGIDIYYPLNDLVENLPLDQIISRSDSHLSWRAHHFIFKSALSRHGLRDALPNIVWETKTFVHDLSIWDGSGEPETEEMPWFEASGEITAIHSRGASISAFINPNGRIPLIILSGHSSCSILSTYVRQISVVTVVIPNKSLDEDLIIKYRPNYVISYLTERNMDNAGDSIFANLSSIDEATIARAVNIGRRLKDAGQLLLIDDASENEKAVRLDGWATTAVREAEEIADTSARKLV